MHLAQLVELCQAYKMQTCLRLSYLPYGRQDKRICNDATFALDTFCHLLNALCLDEIICMDPHSNFAERNVKNLRAIYPIGELEHAMSEVSADLICYPDAGAKSKYTAIYNNLVGDAVVFGEKVRDQSSGRITSCLIDLNKHCIKGQNVLIVDDICDGGMTFRLLAKQLYAEGAALVHLFVTHGLFSAGLGPLREDGIKRIFTQKGEV